MTKSINPYCALPFYVIPDDLDWQCPVYCPTTALPPFQLRFSSEVSSGDAVVYQAETGQSQVFDVSVFNQDGFGFVEYQGENLATELGPGPHRIKLYVDGDTYVSHLIQAAECFNDVELGLEVTCDALSSGDHQYTASILSGGGVNELSINFGTGFVHSGNDEGSWLRSQMSSIVIIIQAKAYLGEAYLAKQYAFSYNPSSPCDFSVALYVRSSFGLDRFSILKWSDASDKPNLGLIYSTGYENKFYAPLYRNTDGVATEEVFAENGQGGRELASVGAAPLLNADIYPIPSVLVPALTAIRWHGIFSIQNLADDSPIEDAFLAAISFPDVEETDCQKAVLQIEYDRRFQSC